MIGAMKAKYCVAGLIRVGLYKADLRTAGVSKHDGEHCSSTLEVAQQSGLLMRLEELAVHVPRQHERKVQRKVYAVRRHDGSP